MNKKLKIIGTSALLLVLSFFLGHDKDTSSSNLIQTASADIATDSGSTLCSGDWGGCTDGFGGGGADGGGGS